VRPSTSTENPSELSYRLGRGDVNINSEVLGNRLADEMVRPALSDFRLAGSEEPGCVCEELRRDKRENQKG